MICYQNLKRSQNKLHADCFDGKGTEILTEGLTEDVAKEDGEDEAIDFSTTGGTS